MKEDLIILPNGVRVEARDFCDWPKFCAVKDRIRELEFLLKAKTDAFGRLEADYISQDRVKRELLVEYDQLRTQNEELISEIKLMSAPHESVGHIVLTLRKECDELRAERDRYRSFMQALDAWFKESEFGAALRFWDALKDIPPFVEKALRGE